MFISEDDGVHGEEVNVQDAAGNLSYQKSLEKENSSKYSPPVVMTEEEINKNLEKIIEGGQISVIESETPDLTYKIFSILAKNGCKGLALIRAKPRLLGKDVGAVAPVYWISSNFNHENVILPTEFTSRSINYIKNFMKDNPNDAIILVEGLEYLSTQVNFDHLLRWYQKISEEIAPNRKCRIIVTYDPLALGEQETRLIRRESVDVTKSTYQFLENLKK